MRDYSTVTPPNPQGDHPPTTEYCLAAWIITPYRVVSLAVWENCMGDLIVNMAVEPVYIHEEGVSNKTKGEANLWLKHSNTQAR